jgi:dephospho-CoA kinase
VLKVALTGGIATGKSYIARLLVGAGVAFIDADVLARQELAPGTSGLAAVRTRFGDEVMTADGSLDRKRLADIIFRDEAARRELEAIVHPAVIEAIQQFFRTACGPDMPVAVADVPLLYEGGFEHAFDRVIVAACPREMQIARVMARDRATREAAERRVAAQLPIEEKVRRAHYVIRTDRSFAETDRQVAETLEKLRQES